MSILVSFVPASMTAAQYDEAQSKLEEAGIWPPDGLDHHICFGTDGALRVSEVWDSQDQLDAFGERLMPILSDVEIDPGKPEVVEIYNTVRR